MAIANETARFVQPWVVALSRTFDAPRELVFKAWTSAEHLKRWFCPACFTVPEAVAEFRVGGRFEICMRGPNGDDHWTRGHYTEIEPGQRLVIDMDVVEGDGVMVRAHTEITFADAGRGTRMDVRQTYTPVAPDAEMMVQHAPEGWEQTLDALVRELARMQESMPSQSVVHGSFRIERTFAAPRDRVFRALTDPDAKAKWFTGGQGYTILEREMDIRPGGRERLNGRWESGLVTTYDAVYFDVVPDERIVFAYEMHLDQRKISVSLATYELKSIGDGTQLVLTENGAFLDGYDDAGSRERGSNLLLDAVGKSLLQ
jgi:uncharacterized protein YndB with AHSA1/START domain